MIGDEAAAVATVPQPYISIGSFGFTIVVLAVFAAAGEVDETFCLQVVTVEEFTGGFKPQEAVTVFADGTDVVRGEGEASGLSIAFGQEGDEGIAVVAAESVQGSHPYKPFAVLEYIADGIIGKPVGSSHLGRTYFYRG